MNFEDFISDMPYSPSALMGLGVTLQPISSILKELPTLRRQLEPYHPIKSASIVAGLLVDPLFHANTLRIESLIYLFVAFAAGNRRPSTGDLDLFLNDELGATLFACMEDPVEDVFISNVTTRYGNRRIFEGTWESSDFYLQRILNLVETLPDSQDASQLKREIHTLILIGDEIARRMKLSRFCQGEGSDKSTIRIPSATRLKSLRQAINFTFEDLKQLSIQPTDLEPFIFQPQLRNALSEQFFGDNELIRRPIVKDEGNWFIILPTAISVAVRKYVLDWISSRGFQDSFDEHLVMEYHDFLYETPILGAPLPQDIVLPPKTVADKVILDICREVDKGRYLHLLTIIDGISGYLNHGFSSPDQDPMELSGLLEKRIENMRNHFQRLDGFKQGLSLLVGCGYGRPSVIVHPTDTKDWKVEIVSAPDLQALAWLPGAPSLIIWKLIEQQRFLAEHDVSIANANGLLNLYGWWKDSNFLMIHPQIEFPGNPIHISIPTDCMAGIRKIVRQGWDLHSLPLPNGEFALVRRMSADSCFPGEADRPLYASIEAARSRRLLAAWVGVKHIWWVSAEHEESGLSRDLVYRTWDAVNNWQERSVPVLECHINGLIYDAVMIVLDFNNAHQDQEKPIKEDILLSCISVSSDKETSSIRISFRDPFFAGFRNPKNVAERAILRALTIGFLDLAGNTTDDKFIDKLVNEIVPDDDARCLHMFEAVYFRDHIQLYDQPEKLFIDDADDARSKLGLGWLAHNKANGDMFTTASESVKFLNSVVDAIWKRMRIRLHEFDREDFIKRALWYLEGVEADMRRWQRTIRAVIALRTDKESAKLVAIRQIARCSASEMALRLLVEMAIPECPLKGGKAVGKLDLTPLMSDILMIFHLGGCSDAIKKGVMDPVVKIAPCGDVLTHIGFRDEITTPMGEHFESVRLDHEVDQYEKHYQEFEPVVTVKGSFHDVFLKAFEDEFGFSIDALRGVRESLENLAIEKKACVFTATKTEILEACVKTGLATLENTEIILEAFALWPRQAWDYTPKGFEAVDWYPWRFGRQLSLVRRPIVRLEEENNPRYVISPGLFGVGIALILSRYFEAEIDVSKCVSRSMKCWIDEETNRKGRAFEKEVFENLRNLGFEALLGTKVTALVNDKLDQDYGDVDVLAWKAGGGVLFAIECKDLKIARTPNEIAEQLNRFSGQVLPNGERDNLLKHLDRCRILEERVIDVAKFIGSRNRDMTLNRIVCFSKPVPMQYVASRFPNIAFVTIDNINDALN